MNDESIMELTCPRCKKSFEWKIPDDGAEKYKSLFGRILCNKCDEEYFGASSFS